ncbi:MAG TPA: hypothetical protein VFK05_37275 [Polyangiaceae bacterium]|nr:hypothetical protein [Polyangiaceae bacterium]
MRPLSHLAALAVLLLNACYPAGDGKPPPLEELYFPTGLAFDDPKQLNPASTKAPNYLYVVNSDFDLQYRSASVISYDLAKLRDAVPRNCNPETDCGAGMKCDVDGVEVMTSAGVVKQAPTYYCVDESNPQPCQYGFRDEADLVLYPGRCQPIESETAKATLVAGTVGIGAFATDVIWRQDKASGKQRLFIPVRGDSTLHWIDVEPQGQLECGQKTSEDGNCDDEHRSGDVGADNLDNLKQPQEPYAIDTSSSGEYVAITNQTQGSVSLFRNDWGARDDAVKLVNILSGLPVAPVAISALPKPAYSNADVAAQAADGFLVAYRSAAQIDLLRVRDAGPNPGGNPNNYDRYVLQRTGSVPINANSLGFDSRGITIDDEQRRKDYAKCDQGNIGDDCKAATDPLQCCYRAVHQPSVYVASRAPASLLVGAMTADPNYLSGTSELPSFTDSLALTFGPSRVIVGDVRVAGSASSAQHDDAGPFELERRIFVVCFDSRRIFVYDPKRRAIEAIVSTGRGPYALAVDGARGLAYLGHFTDSYLGVISLDQRFPQTYAAIVASIGTPKAPRTSK